MLRVMWEHYSCVCAWPGRRYLTTLRRLNVQNHLRRLSTAGPPARRPAGPPARRPASRASMAAKPATISKAKLTSVFEHAPSSAKGLPCTRARDPWPFRLRLPESPTKRQKVIRSREITVAFRPDVAKMWSTLLTNAKVQRQVPAQGITACDWRAPSPGRVIINLC